MTNSYKKEYPFVGYAGFGGGVGALSAKSSAVSTKYVDEVFSTYTYIGDGTNSHQIVNGVPLSSTGGLIWGKERGNTGSHYQFDTVRGLDKRLKSNSDAGEETDTFYSSVNSDGYTIEKTTSVNVSSNTYVSWTWAKKKGLLDIVSYTGNGSNRLINHSLGSVPGMMIVKCTSETRDWVVWHRHLETPANYAAGYTSGDYYVKFNDEASRSTIDTSVWDRTDPTATQFKVGTSDFTNKNGESYIAYIFAGGASPAATAKSVHFDNGDYLYMSSSSDLSFGTGDYTVECWVKPSSISGNLEIPLNTGGSNNSTFFFHYDTNQLSVGNQNAFISNQATTFKDNKWYHIAACRSGTTLRLFQNGVQVGADATDNIDWASGGDIRIGTNAGGSQGVNGQISNLRVVKGTALYTSSFRVPTEPLTNITNTVLLCCQSSTVTDATVSPGSLSNYNTTAYADSPFDDPAAFKFGENEDTPIIKTGVYVGDATAGNKVELGWEPSWIMFKRITGGNASWEICDVMRGDPANDGTTQNANFLRADTNAAEFTNRPFSPYSTGFDIRNTGGGSNASGDRYIYMAMRRPDGYVGKPASVGTDVFAMDVGNSSSTIPTMDSGFPVDFAIMRNPGAVDNNNTGTRLTTQEGMKTNSVNAGSNYNSSSNQWMWDSNVGWLANSNYGTSTNSWMWKRGQGFDVVTYQGNSTAGHSIIHHLSQTPEMMWVKNRSSGYGWFVYHKNLNGSSNPQDYNVRVNSSDAEVNADDIWNDTAPTSTAFTLGSANEINSSIGYYLALLFASANDADGNPISKVGVYDGSNSEQTITTGFQPRFLIIKRTNGPGNWNVLDTTRGWGPSGSTSAYILLNADTAEGNHNVGYPTATGFTLTGAVGSFNEAGNPYIYYAHA